jgi:DNA-binding MarR family transcriptional regulator
VQSLERAELAVRSTDPTDRRASILELTDEGRIVLERTRSARRERFYSVLAEWPESDRTEFGRLLEQFNSSLDTLFERS